MVGKVFDWLDLRLGIRDIDAALVSRNVPKLNWWYTLGFMALFTFILMAVTGMFLAVYYAPTPDHAYDSVKYLTEEVMFGKVVRGLHHYGASAMVIIVCMHMLQVFFYGAYKYPRELTWVTGALLLFMTMMMGLTGYLLVWDQKAYWATVVAVNITAQAPILGPYLGQILRAGPEFGQNTLSRFYSIHMLLIPGGIATFIAIHLALVSKLGIAETPWSKRRLAVEAEEEDAKRRAARERIAHGRTPVPAGQPAPDPVRTEVDA